MGLLLALLVMSATVVWAQNFSRQGISFSLFDKTGKQLTDAAIVTGQVKVYSLREAKTATDPHVSYDKTSKLFTFTESVISPGIMMALVSATDTMYLSVYGRSGPDRVIDGLTVQKGNYVLTSNEFGGRKRLKVESWNNYIEAEDPDASKNLASLAHVLKEKTPISIVKHNH